MRTTRRIFILAAILSALHLFATTAGAQTSASYRFLEVVDTAGKPVADAKVEQDRSVGGGDKQTDAHGDVKEMPVYVGDFNTRSFMVSKEGFLPYEVKELSDWMHYRDMLQVEIPGYDYSTPIRVVLLKTPLTAAERKAVEDELRRRELLLAVKQGDIETVRKLLRDGVSPDTADAKGIPAILYAAANMDVGKIKALLDTGANVGKKSGAGRKALLYYLYYSTRMSQGPIDSETAQSLVKAGADVNAAYDPKTNVLSLAKYLGDAELIRLLEKAGAH
jgi:hypothetical protein